MSSPEISIPEDAISSTVNPAFARCSLQRRLGVGRKADAELFDGGGLQAALLSDVTARLAAGLPFETIDEESGRGLQ